MSFKDFYAGVAGIGKAYDDGLQRNALSVLGEQVQGGNIPGAAKTAFDAGDAATGLKLLALGQSQDQQRTASAGLNAVAAMYGGGGFGIDGPQGAPANGLDATGAGRGVPSFLDVGNGPQGDYLTGLFRRESNFKPDAQASTSSARGLGQFTKGTWNSVAAQHPDLGLVSVGPGQDGRTDPQQMIRAAQAHTADNEALLRQSNLPVSDATKYSLHIFGAGGGRRFVAGTLSNPDAPAASYVAPDQVAANRPVFFRRDGTAKTAGEVMGDFARSFGGGGGAPTRQAQAPVGRAGPGAVAVANDEAETQALEQRMGMVPPAAPSRQSTALLDPRADLPAPGAQEAQFVIPPASRRASTGLTPGLSGDGSGGARPLPSSDPNARNIPAVPTLAVPTLGGDAGGRTMQMPGAPGPAGAIPPEARAQVSAQAPQHLVQAGVPASAAQAVSAAPPGSQQRIGILMRVAALPGLPDSGANAVKMLLENEIQQTRLPDDVKQYMVARNQGYGGSLIDFKNELRKPLTPTTVAPGNAVIAPGERAPFYVNPKEDRDEGAKIRDQAVGRRDAVVAQGLDPNDPRIRDFIISGTLPKESQQQLTAGDRKAINDAEDHALQFDQTIGTLSRAKELNGQTYTGAGAGVLGRTGTSFPGAGLVLDPKKAAATREFNQIMSMEAIKSMSATLKGATTDREMDRFVEILGDPATPPSIRANTIDRMLTLAQRQRDLAQSRIGQMREGTYYRPGGGASAGQGGPAVRQGGGQGRADLVAAPPSAAIDHLRQNPGLRAAFDAKYGPGSADQALGGR